MNPSENSVSSVVFEDQVPEQELEKLQINSVVSEVNVTLQIEADKEELVEAEAQLADAKTAIDEEMAETGVDEKDTVEEHAENIESQEPLISFDGDKDGEENKSSLGLKAVESDCALKTDAKMVESSGAEAQPADEKAAGTSAEPTKETAVKKRKSVKDLIKFFVGKKNANKIADEEDSSTDDVPTGGDTTPRTLRRLLRSRIILVILFMQLSVALCLLSSDKTHLYWQPS